MIEFQLTYAFRAINVFKEPDFSYQSSNSCNGSTCNIRSSFDFTSYVDEALIELASLVFEKPKQIVPQKIKILSDEKLILKDNVLYHDNFEEGMR
jgi:hypothetical protein